MRGTGRDPRRLNLVTSRTGRLDSVLKWPTEAIGAFLPETCGLRCTWFVGGRVCFTALVSWLLRLFHGLVGSFGGWMLPWFFVDSFVSWFL
jgi:hypothetical protein